MSKIVFSERTLSILAMASKINPSMLFNPGQVLRTTTEGNGILMTANISETIPQEFSIYELGRLLNVINSPVMQGCELEFEPTQNYVLLQKDVYTTKFFFSSQEIVSPPAGLKIEYPQTDINMQVMISSAKIQDIVRMATTLGHKVLTIVVEGGKIYAKARNPDVDNSNDFSVELSDNTENYADGKWSIKISNLFLISGDYKLTIFRNTASHWENGEGDYTLFVGLERTSS